tara:strand:- start:2282 stop:3025 length:744 start_codon:yes stop_codon:yes gene_type:complete
MGFLVVATIGAVTKIAADYIQYEAQDKIARNAEAKAKTLEEKIEFLENTRQPVINPYEDVESLSYLLTDMSSDISNPFASLGVATGAAEIEIEEADIALANTLDTLRATGASAGGATALAQAALQSKIGVSASIEKQEANNQSLKAQGEQRAQQLRLMEGQRMQKGLLTEAQRIQSAEVKGEIFEYDEFEKREMGALNRAQSKLTGQEQLAITARSNQADILSGSVSELGNLAGSYYQGKREEARIK